MTNIMVDLETMSTAPNAAITSIGAVAFTEEGLGEEFYYTIDLKSCTDLGLHLDPDTIIWWLNQSQEARQIYSEEYYSHAADLKTALRSFSYWLSDNFKCQVSMWGNGASFDNVILSTAYKTIGIQQPWNVWSDRCYRTFKNLHPDIKMDRTGVYHNALDDAKSQAMHMIKIHNDKGVNFG